MKKNKLTMFMFTVLFAVMFFLSTKSANAQTLPDWCFRYTSQDGIEDNSASDWWWWGSAPHGSVVIGPGTPHTGSGSIRMSFAGSDPNGSYLIADRYFDYSTLLNTSLNVRNARLGCGRGNTQPVFPPSPSSGWKTLKFCSASVWVLPSATHGANGSLQLLSTDYTYLAVTDFNFPDSVSRIWQKVSIPPTTNCQTSMIARVGIAKSSSSWAVVFDDLEIVWTY